MNEQPSHEPSDDDQPVESSVHDSVLLGLRIGNWIAAAVYGARGERRERREEPPCPKP